MHVTLYGISTLVGNKYLQFPVLGVPVQTRTEITITNGQLRREFTFLKVIISPLSFLISLCKTLVETNPINPQKITNIYIHFVNLDWIKTYLFQDNLENILVRSQVKMVGHQI